MLSANAVLVLLVVGALIVVPHLIRWGTDTYFDFRHRQEKLNQERVRREILEQELVNKTLADEFTKPPKRDRLSE